MAIAIARSNFRKGGANLPVCRDARQSVAHLSGSYFWQPVYPDSLVKCDLALPSYSDSCCVSVFNGYRPGQQPKVS